MKIKALLDTHPLAWFVLDHRRLGAKAFRLMSGASRGELGIPSAVVHELGRIIAEGKLEFDGRPSDVFGPILEFHGVRPASLDAAIAAPALALPHGDPYDRLIVAEALVLGMPLITKDGNITDSGVVRVIW